jgi:ubiquinone biosynthesis monooxygenase Coq7
MENRSSKKKSLLNSSWGDEIAEMIRVNHAGETGAIVIYEGQIAALKLRNDIKTLELVTEMKSQEIEHHKFFCSQLTKNQIRPTLMQPVWQIGGFALGFLTAIAGKKASMVCTTAVEEVIDEHYQSQIKQLENFEQNMEIAKSFLSGLEEKEDGDKNKKISELEEQKQQISELKNNIEAFRADECSHRDLAYENKAKDFFAFTPLSLAIKAATKMAILISKKI